MRTAMSYRNLSVYRVVRLQNGHLVANTDKRRLRFAIPDCQPAKGARRSHLSMATLRAGAMPGATVTPMCLKCSRAERRTSSAVCRPSD